LEKIGVVDGLSSIIWLIEFIKQKLILH